MVEPGSRPVAAMGPTVWETARSGVEVAATGAAALQVGRRPVAVEGSGGHQEGAA
jgi:hypothetical protein